MAERVEQMYCIFERGVFITLPPEATKSIAGTVANGDQISLEESQRLALINEDTIMKRRHPTAADGQAYMKRVDVDWREHLYIEAERMAENISGEMQRKGKERYVVLLFGSVAKNLARKRDDEDLSNIDMAVIGDFTEDDRLELYDFVREDRESFQNRVGSNLGVHIQCWEKIRNGDYNAALNYIASSARALADPTGAWKELEMEALRYASEQRKKKKISSEIRVAKKFMGITQGRSTEDQFFLQFLAARATNPKIAAFAH